MGDTAEVAMRLAQVVDGNALAGVLQEFAAVDPTRWVIECATCSDAQPLARWVVEVDRSSFIVRCRSCTRTLATLLRDATGVTLRIAGGPSIRI